MADLKELKKKLESGGFLALTPEEITAILRDVFGVLKNIAENNRKLIELDKQISELKQKKKQKPEKKEEEKPEQAA